MENNINIWKDIKNEKKFKSNSIAYKISRYFRIKFKTHAFFIGLTTCLGLLFWFFPFIGSMVSAYFIIKIVVLNNLK